MYLFSKKKKIHIDALHAGCVSKKALEIENSKLS
jgi:hypothetical protein